VRPDLARSFSIERCADERTAEALIAQASRHGGAVAYIRNSVDDAIATFERLNAEDVPAELFHARFAMGDRLAIEERVLARFGRSATDGARRGRVLVATQVAEQSLDFDVDLMITDLAPVDLVIQRAGRLWRHDRHARGCDTPKLMVVSPDPTDGAGANWFSEAFPRGQWVYRNHALLWLSARNLFAQETIHVPDDLSRLVESVYAQAAIDRVPASLQRSAMTAMGKDVGGRALAALNVIDFQKGYSLASGSWGPDTVTPTRLGEERVILRLGRIVDGRLVPWIENEDMRRAWSLSEVSVRKTRFAGRIGLPAAIEAQAAAQDARWADEGVPAVAVPLTLTSQRYRATCQNPNKSVDELEYDKVSGLCWRGLS
jgi:CRISPR-associated endonuclease/helicase Cas3